MVSKSVNVSHQIPNLLCASLPNPGRIWRSVRARQRLPCCLIVKHVNQGCTCSADCQSGGTSAAESYTREPSLVTPNKKTTDKRENSAHTQIIQFLSSCAVHIIYNSANTGIQSNKTYPISPRGLPHLESRGVHNCRCKEMCAELTGYID